MRHSLLVALVSTVLFAAPSFSTAAPIIFEADGGGIAMVSAPGGLFWKTRPEHVITDFASIVDFELWTPPGTAVQHADGSWDFSFPSGIITVWDMDVDHLPEDHPFTPADIPVTPGLLAVLPVLAFSLSLTPPHADSVWEIWVPARPVASQVEPLLGLTLGAGRLRDDFAASLGVSPVTAGGDATWVMDDYLHNPTATDCYYPASAIDDSLHCAINNNARVQIDTQPVPEPVTAVLLAAGIAAVARRRQRTKAAA